ncbi:hypothetical protein BJ684DRAFT_14611 [Piptocephalis cylindrospora]|uniref:Uncharacterized protein n=1 Tax=Piptocephalis cylindrospora TaxID=1907219 RepID=A0A4P9Y7J8_9FUNG|nr:hypothetical protein BJ684DRAFT_14611 [Piptocephalis cylindrospora]|eukprot:RKP15106.1 hypothetical protein BJ684DRAFT_14611 [Piptocephalis cylindrospora]
MDSVHAKKVNNWLKETLVPQESLIEELPEPQENAIIPAHVFLNGAMERLTREKDDELVKSHRTFVHRTSLPYQEMTISSPIPKPLENDTCVTSETWRIYPPELLVESHTIPLPMMNRRDEETLDHSKNPNGGYGEPKLPITHPPFSQSKLMEPLRHSLFSSFLAVPSMENVDRQYSGGPRPSDPIVSYASSLPISNTVRDSKYKKNRHISIRQDPLSLTLPVLPSQVTVMPLPKLGDPEIIPAPSFPVPKKSITRVYSYGNLPSKDMDNAKFIPPWHILSSLSNMMDALPFASAWPAPLQSLSSSLSASSLLHPLLKEVILRDPELFCSMAYRSFPSFEVSSSTRGALTQHQVMQLTYTLTPYAMELAKLDERKYQLDGSSLTTYEAHCHLLSII